MSLALAFGRIGLSQEFDLYKTAQNDFQHKDFTAAAALFQDAEKHSPGATDALLYLAKCRMQLNQVPEANAALSEYATRHPADADAAFLRGYLLFREDQPAASLAAYTHAATLATPKADDLKIVALDYVLLGDNASAVRWLRQSVQFNAGDPEAWYFLGRSLFSQSQFPEAEQAFHQALRLAPHSSRAWNNLGLTYEAENRTDDALKAYERAIADDKSIRRQPGTAASSHGEEEEGLIEPSTSHDLSQHAAPPQAQSPTTSSATTISLSSPTGMLERESGKAAVSQAQPYLNYGSLLIRQNRISEAVEVLRDATRVAPECAVCHQQLGRALDHMADLHSARTELEQAVRLQPDEASFHYELAILCRKLGDSTAAATEFNRSKQMYGTRAHDPAAR